MVGSESLDGGNELEDVPGHDRVELPDVDSLFETQLDMSRAGPELKLGVEVHMPRVLARPHVDGFPRQGVDLA